MNLCHAKQKAFAQRVYFDLKICRKWFKLNVYFDEINKWIFFLGKPLESQPLTFVLPISSDEQLTMDDLFNLRLKLLSSLTVDMNENIPSVLMAIIANDFTLAYFNFTTGLPSTDTPVINPGISNIDEEFVNEIKKDSLDNDEWNTNVTWD